MKYLRFIPMLLLLLSVAAAPVANADPYPGQVGTCSYDAATSIVTAINLPTILPHAVYGSNTAVINFIRESSASAILDAFVLGATDTGTMTVAVPTPVGLQVCE